jgi:CHAT domain-containing protein
VRARVEACTQNGDASSVLEPGALDEVAELWLAAQLEPEPRLEIINVLAWLHWCRYLELPQHLDREDLAAALQLFTLVGQAQPGLVPDEIARILETARPENQDLASLYNRGVHLFNDFQQTGQRSAIDQALTLFHRTADVTPADHPRRGLVLSGLGAGYMARFESFGDTADLDRAITRGSEAVQATLVGHEDRPHALTNLGMAYLTRYQRFENSADLDESIRYCTEAAQQADIGPPGGRKLLSNAGLTYREKFELSSDEADLAESIRYAEAARRATPADDTESVRNLANLAGAYQVRFTRSVDPTDLSKAIEYWHQAEQASRGHADHTGMLSGLGLAYQMRFEQTGSDADLDRAIRYGTEAIETTSGDHPDRAMYLNNLAPAHRARFERGMPGALDQAINCWRDAVSSPTAPTHQRVAAAIAWGVACESLDDPALAAEGFASAVRLLPLLAWRGLERRLREKHLADVGGLVTDAAGWAIEAGDLENAVELLEQGRSILWSQSLQLRTDLTRLRTVNQDLALRLDEVRAALDRPLTVSGAIDGGHVEADWNQERHASRHRELARQWDDLVRQVRNLQGLETFLEATPFSRLREAASGGPVVMVNISNRRCDALIVTATGVRLRPLPGLTAHECTRRANRLLDTLYPPKASAEAPTALQLKRIQVLFGTMSWLWDTICGPILKDLEDEGDLPGDQPGQDGAMPRLWWCPTGPLTVLPLHAAGHHAHAHGECLSRVAVSSYTPTVEALLRSRERAQTDTDTRILAVGMPTTPSFGDLQFHDLPAAPRELARITEALPDVSMQVLLSPTRDELNNGTFAQEETQPMRDRVLRALRSHSWVHFACHGGQDLMDPSHGAVYLTDGPLTVLQLATEELPAAELAFLSACQTAVGGVRLPDETIHLAAALQFAGYRHVIATAWSISDSHAPEVAKDTYTELTATGRLDASRAAAAIHHAVENLRAREPSRPDLWAPYLHIGP